MIRIKICGITNKEDALKAVALGAWAIGFVFHKESPRYIGPYKAKRIIESLPPFITPVGVFVNQKEGAIKDIAEFCSLGALQFHGDESPEFCRRFKNYRTIKAFRLRNDFNFETTPSYKTSALLLDSYQEDKHGGTGKTWDWALLKKVKHYGAPIILSGGLNAKNIKQAIEEVRPFAVDVSSGVEESPGKKNERLLKEFFDAAYLF